MTAAYVYAITVDGIVRYVGKGRRYRVREHLRIARLINRKRLSGAKVVTNRFYNRLAAAMRRGASLDEIVYQDGLTDDQAFDLEIRKIAEFPAAQLWNVQAGGEGHSSESAKASWTSERRATQSRLANRRWTDPEERARHSETIKGQWEDPGYREHHIAKQKARWEEPGAKALGGEIARERWRDPDYRARVMAKCREYWSSPEGQEAMKLRNKKVAVSRARNRA